MDASGNFFLADSSNDRIRRVEAATGIITTVVGTGEPGSIVDGVMATAAPLNFPSSVSLDAAGNLFVADTRNHAIRRVDASSGIITTVAGTGELGFSGDGGPATAATLLAPTGVAVDSAGNIYIAEYSQSPRPQGR